MCRGFGILTSTCQLQYGSSPSRTTRKSVTAPDAGERIRGIDPVSMGSARAGRASTVAAAGEESAADGAALAARALEVVLRAICGTNPPESEGTAQNHGTIPRKTEGGQSAECQ